MKLSTTLSLLGLGLGAVGLVAAQGCGDSESTGGTSSAGKVPPAEEGAPTTDTTERTFALNQLFLGESDRAGGTSGEAWKKYGYNLDGQVTTAANPQSPDLANVCKKQAAAGVSVHQDGEEGTDNAFGKSIIPLLTPFTSNPSKSITDSLKEGDFTILLTVKGLTDVPEQTNTGLSGTLRVGGQFSEADPPALPTFTTADDWPYVADPIVPLPGAYINKGVFVNGRGGATVNLAIGISGQSLSLTIKKAIITFKHNPATKEITEGVIAGVLDTEQFITGIGSVAGRFSSQLCEGSTVEGVKEKIRAASDMMADGSQNPAATCDGISVGIGFTGKQVGNPTKVAPTSEPPADPCKGGTDAGTDSGTDSGTDAGTDSGSDAGDGG